MVKTEEVCILNYTYIWRLFPLVTCFSASLGMEPLVMEETALENIRHPEDVMKALKSALALLWS